MGANGEPAMTPMTPTRTPEGQRLFGEYLVKATHAYDEGTWLRVKALRARAGLPGTTPPQPPKARPTGATP